MHAAGLERWDDLRVFLEVMRRGSFSAAAEALGVEQSTVSRRIASLELSLGAPLFDRLPGAPRATELAQRMRAQAEAIEAQVHALAEAARGQASGGESLEGRVRLALTESFAVQVVLPHIVSELAERHPRLALDLVVSDLAADLSFREADLALRFFRPSRGDLVVKRLARLPVVVLAHERYVRGLAGELGSAAWIALELAGVATPEQELLARRLGRPARMRVNSHLSLVEAVRGGHGVAPLTRALRYLYPELIELELGLPALPDVELWLATPRALRNVARVAAVWSLLEARLAQLSGL